MDAVREALLGAAGKGLIPPGTPILLAVSGGADSMALLYGAAELAPTTPWTLTVAHVHHGWRGREADRDLAFVAAHARPLGLADRRAIARRVDRLALRRDELDRDFEERIRPAIAFGRNVVIARAKVLERAAAELARLAVFECAAPFAAPGKPPLTGGERE